ncbi:MAG: hypothetical protein CMJ35_15930 [Phycisphaerae bacterium]|nr:hypothetical protein [Phycisphaerae bacterium]MBM93077.1 hypothetical protein [Phycisphaerae bacterium]|tara:strand:- start:928 stop:1101 length:174 start_codon:yes stop_codon:yes gene_type:complete
MKTEKNKHNARAITGICALVLAGCTMMLGACNTVEGAGNDIEAAGDAISDTASDAKD